MTFRIGVDIGGTFTDFTMYDEANGVISLGKVPTTPSSPDIGCLQSIRENAGAMSECMHFLHGTTVGLNALLERRGATVGLLCTEGFRDVLELRRGSRPQGASLSWTPPPPLVPRHLRLPVGERIDANGVVLKAVDAETVRSAYDMFIEENVTAIAVCLINSYTNVENELAVERALRALGYEGYVSLSHRVSREYRDYERTSTTVVDAFVQARMAHYLQRVQQGLRNDGFVGTSLIVRSGGGAMTFREAEERAFETIMSGPVAGAEGAAELARALDLGDLVSADVGGTSFDTCLIQDGRPHRLYQGEVADQPIQASWIDVRSIGAGGGSIAFVDDARMLHVGPISSGAVPGPACYGRGGTHPTTTDAAFYLGMLGRGQLASGLTLDRVAAEAALAAVAETLALSEGELASGIIQIASAAMANAIREITIEQGVDPRSLKLLAIGGAGPMLATQIARELQMTTVVVPPHAGNFSAWGLLGADIVRETARTVDVRLDRPMIGTLEQVSAELIGTLHSRIETPAELAAAQTSINLDIRYSGQEHSLTLPIAGGDAPVFDSQAITATFAAEYLKKYGIVPDSTVEVTAVRCSVRTALPLRKPRARQAVGEGRNEGSVRLHSFAADAEVEGLSYQRDQLVTDRRYHGPAVIYEATTTTYVDSDFTFYIDINDCLYLTKESGK